MLFLTRSAHVRFHASRFFAAPKQHACLRCSSHARGVSSTIRGTIVHRWPTAFASVGALATIAVLGVSCAVYLDASKSTPDAAPTANSSIIRSLRAYIIYSMCSVPFLVDRAPETLEFLFRIPLVDHLTAALVKATFFDQFVGGESAEDCVPILQQLRSSNTGALFAYSVEVDEKAKSRKLVHGRNSLSSHKLAVEEMIHSIDVAGDYESSIGNSSATQKTWVAIKLTALLADAASLARLSQVIHGSHKAAGSTIPFPGTPAGNDLDLSLHSNGLLTQEDKSSLRELHSDMIRICQRAKERGVKLIVDAEHSWYQPALDALCLDLMRRFNTDREAHQPLVYTTVQAYHRRAPQHLQSLLDDATRNGYAAGIKLVRGAYHQQEMLSFQNHNALGYNKISGYANTDSEPPVWSSKVETDHAYNLCAKLLLEEVSKDIQSNKTKQGWTMTGRAARYESSPRIGVLFATHNWESCRLILRSMHENGLAVAIDEGAGSEDLGILKEPTLNLEPEVSARICFGQLYGMGDGLTEWIIRRVKSSSCPFVIKYVPYGPLSDVMPYLARRAIENNSVLGKGGAVEERKTAASRILRSIGLGLHQ